MRLQFHKIKVLKAIAHVQFSCVLTKLNHEQNREFF